MINSRKAMDKLFISRVRIKLLKYFFMNPDVPIHLRGAVREINEEINAVRRELMRLEEIKLLNTDPRGNRKYYLLNREGPFIEELRGIIFKTYGLGGEVIRNIKKLGDLKFAILTGEYLLGQNYMQHPVDFVVIGNVVMEELKRIVLEHETKEKKEINYTVFSYSDFDIRKKRNDAFIMELLMTPKLMLYGAEEEMIGV